MDTKKFKMGWMIVAFDLPVGTKEERKAAGDFRKFPLEDGYQMMQYSVYVRPMVTFSRMQKHMKRLREHTPPNGALRAIFVTESQWERSYVVYGKSRSPRAPEEMPEQLHLW